MTRNPDTKEQSSKTGLNDEIIQNRTDDARFENLESGRKNFTFRALLKGSLNSISNDSFPEEFDSPARSDTKLKQDNSKEPIDLSILRMKEPEMSEPSQSSMHEHIERPINFFIVLPTEKQIIPNEMYSLQQVAKNRNIEWRSYKVATEDLRVTQYLSTCLECFSVRPLAIFMPCGHGGCCLRCSVKKEFKQKLCPYCSKVNHSYPGR